MNAARSLMLSVSKLWASLLIAAVLVRADAHDWETGFTLTSPEDQDDAPYRANAILVPPFPITSVLGPTVLVGIEWGPSDLVIPNLFTGTFVTKSFNELFVSHLSFAPVTRTLYAASRSAWEVLKSLDAGASWLLVDKPPQGFGFPKRIVADDRGALYVLGYIAAAPSGYPTTLIRKSSDQGATWSTVNRLSGLFPEDSLFVPGPDGGLFVVGFHPNPQGPGNWMVRRSRDEGLTWVVVDSFRKPNQETDALSIACDSKGRIFVAGYSSPDPVRWDVRESGDGGTTWKTISPPDATGQFSGLARIAVDPNGDVLLVGLLDDWAATRRTADGVWQKMEFPFGSHLGPEGWASSRADAITTDRVGNAFVVGSRRIEPDGLRWEVVVQRRFIDPPVLGISVGSTNAELFWTAGATNYILESSTSLSAGAWRTVTNTPTTGPTERSLELPRTAAAQFFRLTAR